MQSLIVSGKLPCTKEESCTLAAIQYRIYELAYMKLVDEEKEKNELKQTSKSATKKDELTATLPPKTDSVNEGFVETGDTKKVLNIIQETPEETDKKTEIKSEPNKQLLLIDTGDEAAKIDADTLGKQCNHLVKEEINKLIRSMSETSKLVEKIISQDSINLKMPILTNSTCESLFFLLKTCSCLSSQRAFRSLSIKQLVAPNYQRSNDIIKLIKVIE